MKKVVLAATLALLSVGVHAGVKAQQAPAKVSTVAANAATPIAPIEYQEMLNKYCITCHNQKLKIPAGAPLALDQANLKDPSESAEIWEKVIRKLGVGAMPPQGSPTPGPAELNKLRSALISNLDAAAAKKNYPGRYVIHRLNRTEYANAIRDLLGVEIDAAEFLPSDGGDFGFDNIASALKSSPLLLERYLTAALQISDLAVGDTEVALGTATFSISTVVTQNEHVDGLPIGTRGGKLVRYDFPADGEYVLYGRLLRTVAEGYVGVEGHDTPYQFIITLDGDKVFDTQIGGKADHESSSKNITISREEIDKRMTSPRIKITAGPHEVGFTWVERPAQEQNVWQPPLRDSLEAHNPAGIPRLRSGNIEGPYNVTGISDNPTRQRIFVCKPTVAAKEAGCAQEILTSFARRAYRRPVVETDVEAPLSFYNDARKRGGDFNAGIRAGLARILASPSFIFRTEQDPATLAPGAAHRVSDLELASRL
jgi:cytochrome c5